MIFHEFLKHFARKKKQNKTKIKACFSYLYMDSNFSAGYPMAIIRSHIYVRSKSYFLFEISSTCLCLFLDTMVFKADAIFILQKKGSFGQIFKVSRLEKNKQIIIKDYLFIYFSKNGIRLGFLIIFIWWNNCWHFFLFSYTHVVVYCCAIAVMIHTIYSSCE